MENLALIIGGLGAPELLIILAIIILIFGARKIPELAKSMGEAVREFRKAAKEGERPPVKPEKEDEKQ